MENSTSIIKWQTGVPAEMGKYLIVTDDWSVNSMYFHPKEAVDLEYFECWVIKWCKLTDINPHEEK
jgi:hypothetical protein